MALLERFKKKKGEEFLELGGAGLGAPGGAMAEPAAAPELPGLPAAPPEEPAFPMPGPMAAPAPAAPPGGDMASVVQKLDLISSKLDAIKAELGAVTQRLNNIEYGLRSPGEQPPRPTTPGVGETGWRY